MGFTRPRLGLRGTLAVDLDPIEDLTLYARVQLTSGPTGLQATPLAKQGSHQLLGLVGADALAVIPPGDQRLLAGAWVDLIPLDGAF